MEIRRNKELAKIFSQLGDALEFLGEIQFKVIAYRKASRFLENFPEDILHYCRKQLLKKFEKNVKNISEIFENFINNFQDTDKVEFDEFLKYLEHIRKSGRLNDFLKHYDIKRDLWMKFESNCLNKDKREQVCLKFLVEVVDRILYKECVDILQALPGIGSGIAKKIVEYFKTGKVSKYENVMKKVPSGILELLQIPSLGPKTLKLAHDKLGVRNLEDLKRVLKNGSLARLPGMGLKKVQNILEGISLLEKMKGRMLLGEVFPLVENIINSLKTLKEVKIISPAGSFRRMKETVGDIDILVVGENGQKIIEHFVNLPGVTRILASGTTKGSCIFEDKIQVDLRVVPKESFGAALQYFTGSKEHNIHLRTIAKSKNLKISEYGVFKVGDKEIKVAGESEEEVYDILGLSWIPPELREDRGEIEAAQNGTLPKLVEEKDIKGDFHVHSKYSDGTASLEEIADYGIKRGYEYIIVADHSQSVKYAGGLDVDTLREKIKRIRELNKHLESKGFRLIAGAEVDILQDGSLDYPDEVLKELDFVIGAIHIWSKKEDVTERVLKAMDNPYLDAIAHPTGRLIGSREGYNIDLEKVLQKARDRFIFMEINAYFERLDLWDIWIRKAKDMGVVLYIGTDAHQIGQLWMMRLGVGQARRGWLEKQNLLNTLSYDELIRKIKETRKKRGG